MGSQNAKSKWLIGNAETTYDADKARFLIPQKVRDQLGKTFFITKGSLGCLEAFTLDFWDAKVEMIMGARPTNPARATLGREVMGNAEEVSVDSSGRLVLPLHLRSLVKFQSGVVIKGLGDHYEIWPAEEYELFQRNPKGYRTPWTDLYNEALLEIDGQAAAAGGREA